MRTDPVTVLSASSSVPVGLDYRGGDYGELVVVHNPATNSNNVFLALNRDATTAAVTGQQVVAPGQYAFFILTKDDNASGINAIAATGNTVVTVIRQSFRTVAERLAVMGGVFGGAVAAQFWVAISGTQVQLSGSFVEARADTLAPKTAATALNINDNSAVSRIRVTDGGSVDVKSADGTDLLQVRTANPQMQFTTANALRFLVQDAEVAAAAIGTSPFMGYNSAGADARFTLNGSRYIRHGTADGDIDSVMEAQQFPVANGSVIVIGDLVEFVPATQNRIRASGVGSTAATIGQAASAGTGNAGGTIRVVVDMYGYKATPFLADVAGVTEGFYAFPGATNANRLASQPTVENTFAKIRATAASGVAVPLQFMGSM